MNSDRFLFIAISAAVALLALSSLNIWLRTLRLRSDRALLRSISQASKIRASGSEVEGVSVPRFRLVAFLIDSRYGRWLRERYSRAGLWQDSAFEQGFSQKVAFAIAGGIAALFLVQTQSFPIYLSLLVPVIAFLIPDLLIIRRSGERLASITRNLPETIDLLSMCVAAGIGFHAGMQRVANSVDNPLSQEFSRVLAEMRLGRSRSQALLEMSERLKLPALTEFINSVLQVDRLGVPMAKILEEQSRRMRILRHEKARERAQKLPVKILAPIMLFMMPALLIIVLGPAVVTIMRSFG